MDKLKKINIFKLIIYTALAFVGLVFLVALASAQVSFAFLLAVVWVDFSWYIIGIILFLFLAILISFFKTVNNQKHNQFKNTRRWLRTLYFLISASLCLFALLIIPTFIRSEIGDLFYEFLAIVLLYCLTFGFAYSFSFFIKAMSFKDTYMFICEQQLSLSLPKQIDQDFIIDDEDDNSTNNNDHQDEPFTFDFDSDH
jgi:hypothetical protein